jgi:hypothetical protein
MEVTSFPGVALAVSLLITPFSLSGHGGFNSSSVCGLWVGNLTPIICERSVLPAGVYLLIRCRYPERRDSRFGGESSNCHPAG